MNCKDAKPKEPKAQEGITEFTAGKPGRKQNRDPRGIGRKEMYVRLSDPCSMDSVPFVFCRDVCGSLGLHAEKYDELAGTLTGRWKAAATQYAENVGLLEVNFGRDDDGWFYWIFKHGEVIDVPSIDELSALSRRYAVFIGICADSQNRNELKAVRCSREDIVLRLAPLVRSRIRHNSRFYIYPTCLRDVALTVFEMFRTCYWFKHLSIGYHGKESEEFLCAYIEKNPSISVIDLVIWPHIAAVEGHLLKLLGSPGFTYMSLPYGQKDVRISLAMINVVFERWCRAENEMDFSLYGSPGVTIEKVMSIPLPPDVTRTVEKHGTRTVIRWTRRNGWSLDYDLHGDHNMLSLSCSQKD
uniref:SRR1 domain-containing protein n=1 Tax=Steinernema glaseri TaxID=37863 RepID=A0A1I7YWI1_9BILA